MDSNSITIVAQAFFGSFTGLAAVFTAYNVWRKGNKETEETVVTRLEKTVERLEGKIRDLEQNADMKYREYEGRIGAAARRERIYTQYVFDLQRHIIEGKPPPHPPWPADLMHMIKDN